jgi:chromosome segregation ATPase
MSMDVSSSQPPAPGPAAVLVTRNGRAAGQRRSLVDPFILIGKATGCDLRLADDSVAPFHCALVLTPTGPLLRALSTDVVLNVNGQQVEHARLQGGDVIAVGSFEFALEMPAAPTAEVPTAPADHEALRIQAAAVVAQQAALLEHELRLEQRATALARQEEQLAAHLEQRRKELDERERAAASVPEQIQQLARQRKRLVTLRRRLVARYNRGGKKREAELTELARQVESERDRLRQWYEKANGENELRKRQLQERERELALEQQRWDAALNEEKAAREKHAEETARRTTEVIAAREGLAIERKQWAEYHAWLSQETKGLEARIAAQREQLVRLEKEKRPAPPPPLDLGEPLPRTPVIDPALWPALLREVAGQLGDQRSHLLEQWQQLLRLQDDWQRERDTAQAELEQLAAQLQARERAVAQGERTLELRQAELQRRAEAVARQRSALEAQRVRLATRDAAAEHALAASRDDLDAERRRVESRQVHYERVHQRRNDLRRGEAAALHGLLARLDTARQSYHDSWQDCERLRAHLDQQTRALSGQAVALERARQELLGKTTDPARAADRLDRLTRGEIERLDAEARRIDEERRKLASERSRLDDQAAAIARREADLAERAAAQVAQADAEAEALVTAQEEAREGRDELRRARARHALAERELRQLRDELDRVARALYEDEDDAAAAA